MAILRWRPRFLGRFFIDSLLRPHRPLRRRPISGFPDVGMLRNPPRQSILTRRGGGSEAGMRNELLACFFMSVFKNNVAGPHRPLRRQPISSFLDVGMLQNYPRLSILTRRGGGSEAGMRNRLLACFFVVCLEKLLHFTFGSVVGQ
jgi:hypothetical protein